jgi:hypothetical protein
MTLDTHPILDVERRLGGTGPFVINLHASTAPIGLPSKSPTANEHARLYQIQRVDDGRIRYRLRLGPFATEDEAEVVLAQARLEYPGALLVTAAADDLHAIALVRGRAHSGGASADSQAAEVVPQSVVNTRPYTPPVTAAVAAPAPMPATAVPAAAAAAPAPMPAKAAPVVAAAAPAPAVPASPVAVATPAAAKQRTAVSVASPMPAKAAPVVAAAVPAPAKVAPVVAAVAAPAKAAPAPAVPASPVAVATPAAAKQRTAVSVASDIASMQALMAAIDTSFDAAPNKVATKPPLLYTVPTPLEPVAPKVTARRDMARAGTPTPSLESTQTLRPLTPLELGEHEAPRWFVVQLALSDDAFDPDALPHLDIFSLYRLYTVIGLDQGRLVHALRLGFFAEEVGARAVASYLSGFYDEPIVKRVSVAERDRFADQRVEARKDVGATGRHLAIEITDELVVRGRRSSL